MAAFTSTTTRQASRLWANPVSRAKILAMHAQGASLLDMVSALGLDEMLDADGLRQVVGNLSPAEVAIIRDAFVSEGLAATGAGAHFPIDCQIEDPSGGVTVQAASGAGGAVAKVVPVAAD